MLLPARACDPYAVIEQLGSDEMMMFGSDFPHRYGERPQALVERLPGALQRRVLRENAIGCYGLDVS